MISHPQRGATNRRRARRPAALTPKQHRFVEEYLVEQNGTQAAIRAGYAQKRADQAAYENLRRPEIARAVSGAQKRASARLAIQAIRVLQELARIGFSDLREGFDEQGRLKAVRTLTDDMAGAIASVEVVTKSLGDGRVEYVHKVRAWDKVSALEKLAKHLGLLKDRVEHTGKNGGPIETQAAVTHIYLPENRRIVPPVGASVPTTAGEAQTAAATPTTASAPAAPSPAPPLPPEEPAS